MHPKDEMLRAFVDRELSNSQTLQVREHITRCPACQSRLVELRARAERVHARLDSLAPQRHEQPAAPQTAYRRFTHKNRTTHSKENIPTMLKRKSLWAALTVLTVFALALSLPPVRAWASDLLGLFRVEKITVISFDPSAARESHDNLRNNEEAIEALMEDVTVQEGGEVEEVANAEEAAAKAGFNPRLPSAMEGAKLAVKPQSLAKYTINQPKLQALFDAVGVDVQIPAAADGQDITVEVPSSVISAVGCDPVDPRKSLPEGCTVLMQLPSPTVNAPDGIDMQAMGAAMLEFLGLSREEAVQLSQRIDWTTTLVVPVPQGEGISYQDVSVDGVAGTLLREEDEDRFMVLWVKDGSLYVLSGTGSNEEALQIANSF